MCWLDHIPRDMLQVKVAGHNVYTWFPWEPRQLIYYISPPNRSQPIIGISMCLCGNDRINIVIKEIRRRTSNGEYVYPQEDTVFFMNSSLLSCYIISDKILIKIDRTHCVFSDKYLQYVLWQSYLFVCYKNGHQCSGFSLSHVTNGGS